MPNPDYFLDLRFHDLRHEGTSRMGEVFEMHELSRANGNRDVRTLRRYYHPRGRDMSKKLASSPMGRKQLSLVRQGLLPPGVQRGPGHYMPAANLRRIPGTSSTSVLLATDPDTANVRDMGSRQIGSLEEHSHMSLLFVQGFGTVTGGQIQNHTGQTGGRPIIAAPTGGAETRPVNVAYHPRLHV